MGANDIIKKSLLEGYATSNITVPAVVVCMLCTLTIALYIYYVYKYVNRNAFYNKSFHLSLIMMAIITAAILLTIQSNIVVSLGMVGALSIVRFRTAIKDPIDLGFLFWAISIGIICGAGLYEIALLASLLVTVGIIGLDLIPTSKAPMMLVVNAVELDAEKAVLKAAKSEGKVIKVKSRNYAAGRLDLIVEVRTAKEAELVKAVSEIKAVTAVSLISHDGEVTF